MTRRVRYKGGSSPRRGAKEPPPPTCPDGWIECAAQESERIAPVWSNQILWCKPLPETLLKIKSYCYTKQCPNKATTTFITYLNKVCPAPANGAVSTRCVLPSPVEGESVGGGPMIARDPKTGKTRMIGGPDTRTHAKRPPPLSKEQQAAARAAALRAELAQLEASTDPTCVRVREAREIGNPPFPCPPPPGPETCKPFIPGNADSVSEEQHEEAPAEEELAEEAFEGGSRSRHNRRKVKAKTRRVKRKGKGKGKN
jgi:hypothetical protein